MATGLVLGALMGFTLQPVYETLRRLLPSRVLASVVIVLAAGHLIVGAVVGFVSLFVTRGAALTATLVRLARPRRDRQRMDADRDRLARPVRLLALRA